MARNQSVSNLWDDMSQAAKNIAGVTAAGSTPDERPFLGEVHPLENALGVQDSGIGFFLKDHYPRVVAMLRRWSGSHEVAEDLAQESAMRLLRYQSLRSPNAWRLIFHRIALNTFNDWGRQQSSMLNRSIVPLEREIGESFPDPGADLDRVHDSREQLSRVIAAIESLPPKCRQVFLLSRSAGMSNQAIAQRCGISVRMVEKQISKALTVCRRRLDETT
ncbi:MAG: RNA polymerase sigma factor [Solimonas sp.]